MHSHNLCISLDECEISMILLNQSTQHRLMRRTVGLTVLIAVQIVITQHNSIEKGYTAQVDFVSLLYGCYDTKVLP